MERSRVGRAGRLRPKLNKKEKPGSGSRKPRRTTPSAPSAQAGEREAEGPTIDYDALISRGRPRRRAASN